MSDYTYIRPTDPAATEAELTEAMYVQAAPLDLEYTYDAPPVRLVRPSEVAELRAKLDAATQRAEAAEARALEEEAISYDIAAKAALDAQNWREELTVMRQRLDAAEAQLAAVPDYAAYYAAAWEAFESDPDGPEPLDFAEWLAQRASSQRSE